MLLVRYRVVKRIPSHTVPCCKRIRVGVYGSTCIVYVNTVPNRPREGYFHASLGILLDTYLSNTVPNRLLDAVGMALRISGRLTLLSIRYRIVCLGTEKIRSRRFSTPVSNKAKCKWDARYRADIVGVFLLFVPELLNKDLGA